MMAWGSTISEGNYSMGGIVGGDTDLDPISFDDLDPVLFHPPWENTSDDDLIVAFYFHGATA